MIHFHRLGFQPAGVIFCAFFTFAAMVDAGTYSGGEGTAEDPYWISTVADWSELIATSADWDKNFILINDIDFGGANLTPVGKWDQPFTGIFDGHGHVLRNIVFEWQLNREAGLFGYIDNGRIQNLDVDKIDSSVTFAGSLCVSNRGTIRNCHVTGDSYIGGWDVGGLCAENLGTIDDCSSTASVFGGSNAGGLCGFNGGTIQDSFATGWVVGEDGCSTGGLCGTNENGTITGCYATGGVMSHGFPAGLCCSNSGTITNCYATGNISDMVDHIFFNGLCAVNGGTISNCFWDVETTECPESAGGEGKTTAEMKTLATFAEAGWDFVGEMANGTEDVWRMCADGVGYPRLSWEFAGSGDFACPDLVRLDDLLYLAGRWLASTPETVGAADGKGDGKGDMIDYALLASEWMRE